MATTDETPTTYLKDYIAFPYAIDNVRETRPSRAQVRYSPLNQMFFRKTEDNDTRHTCRCIAPPHFPEWEDGEGGR